MTGKDLLAAFGDISQDYYEEAERGSIELCARPRLRSKPLLVAAIVSLLLVLMGCALVVMHMRDLVIGERTFTDQTGETVHLDILSSQGIRETPNYLANQEWLAFTQSYTPDQADGWQSPEEYWAYGVLDQTMADKLEEVCARYGLNVIGKPWHEHVDCYEFLKLAGIRDILKESSEADLDIPRGRYFPGGSFSVYGSLTLPSGERLENLEFNYIRKDVFYDVFIYVDANAVSERNYQTTDGVPLLILEGEDTAMILADCPDAFITISAAVSDTISMETVAEQFDFSIQADAVNAAAADVREQASYDAWKAAHSEQNRFDANTYEEYIGDILWESSIAEENGNYAKQQTYAYYDLDGNGEEELLICVNGHITNVLTIVDGKVEDGKSYYMQLCEDNVLIDVMDVGYATVYHIFRFVNDGDPVFSNPKEESIVRLMNMGGAWWRTSSTDHYAPYDTQITEAEAMEILNAYTSVKLETRPLTEFEQP